MPDPKEDDDQDGGAPTRARWDTGAEGIEQAGVVVGFEDLTPEDRRAGNAEFERRKAESLKLAERLAAEEDDEAAQKD